MPQLGGFNGWIQVDGKPLTEYQVDYSPDGTQATCWIPSEVGKEFEICYRDSVRALTTATKVFVDGTRCGGKILYAKSSERRKRSSTVMHRGMVVSEISQRPFLFSNCQLVEDDDFSINASSIGEISLVIEEVQVHSRASNRTPNTITLPPLQIHERAKKGIVHGTQLGNEIFRSRRKSRGTTVLRTLVSFVFKYRPLAVLMADGAVPSSQPKSYKGHTSTEDVIDLTLDNEKTDNRNKSRSSVKAEIKKERSITFDNTVIDLTG